MTYEWHGLFGPALSDRQIRINEPMRRHTTFGIGGPADCFLLPESVEELQQVCRIISDHGLPLFILGGGANLLVRDGGIRGVVIATTHLGHLSRKGDVITACAGAPTVKTARFAQECGLSGMEFASGIPGSIGGAAYMNAGAYGGDMAGIITEAVTCDRKGILHRYDREELEYAYRHSLFMDNGEVIVSVSFRLKEGDPQEIKKQMEEFNSRRRSKQPLEFHSAGSTFKRPEGHYVGEMIEHLGLKGFSVGEAQVSEKHAGFLINRGHATCEDVLALMAEVQRRVKERYHVDIEPEVQIVGAK